MLIPVLGATPIDVSGTFRGGAYGTWDFGFTGPAGLYLQSISIDLSPTGLKFDTADGGFGFSDSRDVGDYQGTDASTGLSQVLPGTGAALDGGQSLTFFFTDFTAGETFHFTADIDGNPTLAPLRDCSSLPILQRPGCIAQNLQVTIQNDLLKAQAAFVSPQDFSGALVTYTFGGQGYYTTQFTAPFEPAGGLRILGSVNGIQADVQPTPEPATFLPIGIGLLALGAFKLRSRKS
ncbi:MAG: hypothetical protein ACM336_16655 [Acidobacteriota bacterium]